MKVNFHTSAVVLLQLLALCTAQYEPPTPTILPLYPHGIQIYIPDGEGISLVAVHAKINEDFEGLEAGTIARDIVKVKNNRWTYQDRETRLKIGDTVYLWIHVVYNGLGYNLLDQNLLVTEFFNPDGTPHPVGQVTPRPPTSDTTTHPTPDTPIYFPDRGCFRSVTIYNREQHCIGDLLFEDHFDQLQQNKWRVVKQIPTAPDYEFVVYQDNVENLNVKDGELRIKPTLLERRHDDHFIRQGNLVIQDCTSVVPEECAQQAQGFQILPPVASGLIDTKNSFNFIYGRVEIRAKLPRGDWIYPVLSLHPVSVTQGSGYQSGQLRIASVVGNRNLRKNDGVNFDGHLLRAGAVVSPESPVRQNTMSNKTSNDYWSDDYHIYELEWSTTGISVKVDGQSFGEKEWAAQSSPFNKLFYLRIGVAVGGHGEFPDASISGTYTKPWRNPEAKARLKFYENKNSWASTWEDEASMLKVDYVKIWAV